MENQQTIIIKVYPDKENYKIIDKHLTFYDIQQSVKSVKSVLHNDDSKYLIFITILNKVVRYYVYNPIFDDLYLYVNLIEIPEEEVRDIIYKYLLDFEFDDYSPNINIHHQQIQQLVNQQIGEQHIDNQSILKEIAKSAYNWVKGLLKRNKVKSVKEYNKIFGDFSFIEFLSKLFNLYGIDLSKEYDKFFYVYDLVNYNTSKLDYNKFENQFNKKNDFDFFIELNEHRGEPDPEKVCERQEAHQRALEAQKERQKREIEEERESKQTTKQQISNKQIFTQQKQQIRQNRSQQEIEQIKQQSKENAERKYNEANQKLKISKETITKEVPHGEEISDSGSAKADSLSKEISENEELKEQILTNSDVREEKEKEMTEEVEKEMNSKLEEKQKEDKEGLYTKSKEFYQKYIKEHAADIVAVALIIGCII